MDSRRFARRDDSTKRRARPLVWDGQPRALTEEFGEAPLSSGVGEQEPTPVEHEQG